MAPPRKNQKKLYNQAGLEVIKVPLDMVSFHGDRTFRVEDPEGYIWDFATWTTDFDPSQLPPELKL